MTAEEKADRLVKSRVEQLDAIELDKEVLHVLKSQTTSILKALPPSLLNKWEPEIDTILQILIVKLSLHGVGATFGQQLLNIKFLKSQRRTAMLAITIPILLKYFQRRAGDVSSRSGNTVLKKIVERVLHWGDLSVSIGSLLNLLLFLRSGSYPNLLYRILGLNMVYKTPKNGQRQVGYTHMTRELIWHSFIELLVFVLPLIDYHYLKRQVQKILMLGSTASKARVTVKKQISISVSTKCVVCLQKPILPHHMDCEHVFCFYCLQANILADPHFPCPQCGKTASGVSSPKPVQLTIM